MSGWGDFTSLAKSAFNTAQKRIDKVLDIQDDDGEGTSDRIVVDADNPIADVVVDPEPADGTDAVVPSSSHTFDVNQSESAEDGESDAKKAKWSKWFIAPSSAKDALSSWVPGNVGVSSWSDLLPAASDNPANVEEEYEAPNRQETGEETEKDTTASLSTTTPPPVRESSAKFVQEGYEEVDLLTPAEQQPNKHFGQARLTFDEMSPMIAPAAVEQPEDVSHDRGRRSLTDDFTAVVDSEVDNCDLDEDGGWADAQLEIPPVCQEPTGMTLSRADDAFLSFDGLDRSATSSTLVDSSYTETSDAAVDVIAVQPQRVVEKERSSKSLAEELAESGYKYLEEARERSRSRQIAVQQETTEAVRECVTEMLFEVTRRMNDDNSEDMTGITFTPALLQHADCDGDDNLPPSITDETVLPPVEVYEDTFVHLRPFEASPQSMTNLSQKNNRSETSSVINKGSGYCSPTETAMSSDIEIISSANDFSERSSVRSMATASRQDSAHGHGRVGSDCTRDIVAIPNGSHSPAEKKLAQLAEILQSREAKLLDISRENSRLLEEIEQLKNSSIKEQNETVNLQQAITQLKDKYSAVCEEKDTLKRENVKLMKDATGTGGVTVLQLQRVLQGKDEQIKDFIKEGEKLSKKELKHTSIIKKLREKEKETEKIIEQQKVKLGEIEELRTKLRDKDAQELKYDEALSQTQTTVEKQEKRLSRLQSDYDDSQQRNDSLKITIDGCYRQISELQRELATKDKELQQIEQNMSVSQEVHLKERLETVEAVRNSEKFELSKQLDEVRLNLVQSQEETTRVEEALRWDAKQLQKKLQEAELRNQELADGASSATAPLLRQIENLQRSFGVQQSNWERLEKSLYDRIGDLERKAAAATERENLYSVQCEKQKGELKSLRVQLTAATKEKKDVLALVEAQKTDKESLLRMKEKCEADCVADIELHRLAVEGIQKEKELLSSQFEYEKSQMRSDTQQRMSALTAQIEEKEQMLSSLRNQLLEQRLKPQPPTFPPFRRPIPQDDSDNDSTLKEELTAGPSGARLTVDEESGDELWSNSGSGADTLGLSALTERLRQRLQQRDGEIIALKEEVRSAQNSRDQSSHRLSGMQRDLFVLQEKMDSLEHLKQQYQELNSSHQALLQMYGEKVEENEELRLDLDDVKQMYKQQIQDLLLRVDST